MCANNLPTYERIKQALLDEIRRGEYPRDRPFVTEREICQRFDVSRATAIRALNDLMRDGVLSRQRGRGTYVTSPSLVEMPARLPEDGARLIGCIFDHLHGHHPMAIIRGIEHVCRAADYHLVLFDSEGSAHTESLNLARARNAGVHGLIVYCTAGYANMPQFEALMRDNLPLVLIDRYYLSLPTNAVVADDFAVGYELTEALLAQGHRYIGTVCEEVFCTSVQNRLAGYRQAHKVRGLPVEPELVALRPYSSLTQDARRARLASWLRAPFRPTAFMTSNSETLLTLSRDLLGLGVRIPDEATMASMDNSNIDVVLASGAISVALPSYEIGTTAMNMLLDHLTGGVDQRLRHVVLPVTVSAGSRELPDVQAG
jgi:GntR family transcriptional regulator of arabinose operon